MRCKIILISFLTVFIFYGIHTTFAQQFPPARKLTPVGVISPDGAKAVYLMGPAAAEKLKSKWGVVMEEAGVPFVEAKSWKLFAGAAKASADDLARTVADLISRVDVLEKRVDELEKTVK